LKTIPVSRVSKLEYDKELLDELGRVYGKGLNALLMSLQMPPRRYYFRVNTLRVDPGVLLDDMRANGYRVYFDEFWEEALWLPVSGPNNVNDNGCRIVVDKRTAESVMMGANVYAPGVLYVDECVAPGREVTIVSENGVIVANGVVVRGFSEALSAGRGLVVEVVKPLYSVPSLRDTEWYKDGKIYEQSISSMTVARVLNPRPGSVVIDMCAAPGGKTGHVYELLGGNVRLIAVDHSARKVERLRYEMSRLGHSRVEILRADARKLPDIIGESVADYIILDPPCSSLGVVPKVWDKKTMRDVQSLAAYQRSFLRAARRLLKPNGVMVYSTCTMTVVENEENIRYAVEKIGMVVEEAWPRRWSRGIGFYGERAQRVHPSIHGATGYFIARLRRRV
jgi:16S rRNA (cytosine967-C5)-methyltransferase